MSTRQLLWGGDSIDICFSVSVSVVVYRLLVLKSADEHANFVFVFVLTNGENDKTTFVEKCRKEPKEQYLYSHLYRI
ncbi:hypothetical protein A2533_00170 [Candidatus Falkowbacteria bacterium RIFOXYD2_FULL_35_9]|uniref:Uncharacterized protein n=1 Tax=Candidatus Falkowbacteria bacterium RIFOXYC2_FULL_36_12 TaxID=1798002 RepID=A0A1F5T3D8_9BACT|nr:MAG: hypothetical protein A2478_01840 [Candidatus Falkowbacteria bacterium RIFOXYC2_FULL_36_12]OGF33895.1 MAG: hypothetical protein A2223_02460 [Candidatus Falkowbacteria bacterium RIFOXYA2_FULL_35_8]OGF45784.1 MAG: hypothetical protein A2533_00170 [Candidatus Falkowbacteria bacterium RIFOXYD2_FULL_35_9]